MASGSIQPESKNEQPILAAMKVPDRFVCPRCHSRLAEEASRCLCQQCKTTFSIIAGIPCFVEDADHYRNFYEGKFTYVHRARLGDSSVTRGIYHLYAVWAHPRYRFTRMAFTQFLPARNPLLLDFGCGGGNAWLARYETWGVDLSLRSLLNARSLYRGVALADGNALPFRDAQFDGVLSWDVLGHIPLEQKDRVLSQLYRVLKPGGIAVLGIEADSQSPTFQMAKRYPELYQRYFIDQDGHYGLETSTAIIERVRRHGFEILKVEPLNSADIYRPDEILKRFDNEYVEREPRLHSRVARARRIQNIRPARAMANLLVGAAGRFLDKKYPLDRAAFVLMAARRRAE